jgi:hypothetical protein
MEISRHVDSYRFSEVVALWARERLEHEIIIARRLATGFIKNGLRIHSKDSRWLSGAAGKVELLGYPLVGYSPVLGEPPVIIRATALEHLLAVVNSGKEPDVSLLHEEFITKPEFLAWLRKSGLAPPRFWYSPAELAWGLAHCAATRSNSAWRHPSTPNAESRHAPLRLSQIHSR